MNSFQEKCLSKCEDLLNRFNIAFDGFERIQGKNEIYYSGKFFLKNNQFELYVYENEVGFMMNSVDWSICESPDFDTEDDLIYAFENKLGQVIAQM